MEGENGSKINQNNNLPTSGGEYLKPEKNVNIFYGWSINLRKYRFFAIFNFFPMSSLLF
jgi:hypothetical protein